MRLILSFYLLWLIPSWLITAACLCSFAQYGWETLGACLWGKLATSAIIIYLVNGLSRQRMYYYRNLGWSPRKLWVWTLGIDYALFVTGIILLKK